MKNFEEDLEKAYWDFDARKKGSPSIPAVTERDAFKQTVRGLFSEYKDKEN